MCCSLGNVDLFTSHLSNNMLDHMSGELVKEENTRDGMATFSTLNFQIPYIIYSNEMVKGVDAGL